MTTSISTPLAPIKLLSSGYNAITFSDVPVVVATLYGTSNIPNYKTIIIECMAYSPNDQPFQIGLTNDFPASYSVVTSSTEKQKSVKFTVLKSGNLTDMSNSFVCVDSTYTVTGGTSLIEALSLYLVVSGTENDEIYISWVAYEVG